MAGGRVGRRTRMVSRFARYRHRRDRNAWRCCERSRRWAGLFC